VSQGRRGSQSDTDATLDARVALLARLPSVNKISLLGRTQPAQAAITNLLIH
jgi:hypothetical protein